MGKRRRVILVALVIAVIGTVAWLVFSSPPEPTYAGKPLTYWLRYFSGPRNDEHRRAAETAVKAIGTNALPTLLQMLRQKDSPLKPKLVELAKKQHFFAVSYTPPENRNIQVMEAFRVLGTNAAPVVPQLLQIYSNPPYFYSRQIVPQLLGQIGPAAKIAVPMLLNALGDNDPGVRNNVASALGQINAQSKVVVPALIQALKDPDGRVRSSAVDSLGAYGAEARSATPALIELLQDERSKATNSLGFRIRVQFGYYVSFVPPVASSSPTPPGFDSVGVIESALEKVDPEAAAKEGVK